MRKYNECFQFLKNRVFLAFLTVLLGPVLGEYAYCLYYSGFSAPCMTLWVQNPLVILIVLFGSMYFPIGEACSALGISFLILFLLRKWPLWTCLIPLASFAAAAIVFVLRLRTN